MGVSHSLWSGPFYLGSASTSPEVPSRYPAALNGRVYVLDLEQYERETIEKLRQQADDSTSPSERSINPASLWPRSAESWHHGAGQRNFDLEEGDRYRFRASKGVDPWTPGQIGLLGVTDQKVASANDNPRGITAGTRYYLADGDGLTFATDLDGAFTTVTGTPAEASTGMTTDGFHVWVAYPSGPFQTDTSSTAATAFGSADVDVIAYCNGRLVAGHDYDLFELDNVGAVVGAANIFEHPNSGFRWDVIAAAPNAIYAAGHSGNKGEVYRVTIEDTSTELGAPTAATFLPDGEYVTAMLAYVGTVVLGTNKGVRLAAADDAGNLTYGPLVVETAGPVVCLEGEDRFVWFGLSAYDDTSGGLGRLDLSVFVDTLRPAYASDLMVDNLGDVLSVATFDGKRVLTIAGSGVWAEETTKVPSGTIDSGLIRWGTTERKVVINADLRTEPLPSGSSVDLSVAYDDGVFDAVATLDQPNATGPTVNYSTRETTSERAEVRLVLNRATDTTLDPIVQRMTVRALVTPSRSERFLWPIILAEQVDTGKGDGSQIIYDTGAEFRLLKDLERLGLPVTAQEGAQTWTVTVQRVGFKPDSWTTDWRWFNGTCFVLLESLG